VAARPVTLASTRNRYSPLTRYSVPRRVGKTRSPENFTSLINDVSSRSFDVLPDDTWFYPGHGDDSTLGAERSNLPEWRARGW
jgi:glyoxylase-like metal-dependent hydrolase (beta-lactamase superfamily II)